jgi:ribonuclease HII
MLLPRHSTTDTLLEAGLDEAGRGCLWGPLFAAAVIWPAEEDWTEEVRSLSTQIRDSKKVSAKNRAILEKGIQKNAIAYGVGSVEAGEIDRLGMTASNRLAFKRALDSLTASASAASQQPQQQGQQQKPERIIVDGILGLEQSALDGIIQVIEPKADQKYISVAAASILAKEAHDRVVLEACQADNTLEEKYSIACCKGYGTAKHREGVKTHGMHPLHRRLFLRKILGIDHVTEAAAAAATKGHLDFLDDDE